MIECIKIRSDLSLFLCVILVLVVFIPNITYANQIQLTSKQARALQSLNTAPQRETTKSLRLKVTLLKDNQGQKYLGALVNRAELLPYLTKLKHLLADDFNHYRALQAARDQQLFHLTILSPREYQLANKATVDKLLTSNANPFSTGQLSITLLGLGKVALDNNVSFFVVAQSADAQFIRQQFLLPMKDFHITLAFNPSDIHSVNKGRSTLIN